MYIVKRCEIMNYVHVNVGEQPKKTWGGKIEKNMTYMIIEEHMITVGAQWREFIHVADVM